MAEGTCPECGFDEFKWDGDMSTFPSVIIPSVEEHAMELTYQCVKCGHEIGVTWDSGAFQVDFKE
jgi:hypothetical protein